MIERYKRAWDTAFCFRWNHLTPAERRNHRVPRPVWWPYPAKNTYDRATAALPKLLYQRLDEMGLDFAILNPSQGLFAPHIQDDELRGAVCRAFNIYHADIFRDYSDRLTPAACIPMHTPQEAIEELEHAARLGLKVVMMAAFVRRPIPALARQAPALAPYLTWMDNLCLDSEYDYDPVWAKCIELKLTPTFIRSASIGACALQSRTLFTTRLDISPPRQKGFARRCSWVGSLGDFRRSSLPLKRGASVGQSAFTVHSSSVGTNAMLEH